MSRQPYVVQILYNGELISREFETVPYLDYHLFSYKEFFPTLSRNVTNHFEKVKLTWTCSQTGETRPLQTPQDFSTATASLAMNGRVTINIPGDGEPPVEFKDEVSVPAESLNTLLKLVNALEVSLKEKRKPCNDLGFNFGELKIRNRKLIDYLSTIRTESQLNQVIKYAGRYQRLLKSFNGDEAALDAQLDRLLQKRYTKDVCHKSVTPVTVKSDSNENENRVIDTTTPHGFTITVSEKYTNFCFELRNNTNRYFPSRMEMTTNLRNGESSYKISVPHGIGPHNCRTFLRFKREFGSYSSSSDFTNFQLRLSDGNKFLLYNGVRTVCDSGAVIFQMEQTEASTDIKPASLLNETNLRMLEKEHSTDLRDRNSFVNIVSAADIEDIISITLSDVTSGDAMNGDTYHRYPKEMEETHKKYDFLGKKEGEDEDDIPYLVE